LLQGILEKANEQIQLEPAALKQKRYLEVVKTLSKALIPVMAIYLTVPYVANVFATQQQGA
jgi:hypothetical protein